MFRATMCPSSGETTVFMRHLVLVILCGWLSGMQGGTRQLSTQPKKYQVSHKHSCFSWWWPHIYPKHVEINKYTKNKLCTKLALFTRLQHRLRYDNTNTKQCDICSCYRGNNMPVDPLSYSRILDLFISKQLSRSGKWQNKFSELLLRNHTHTPAAWDPQD
jgi:hypothetical protein